MTEQNSEKIKEYSKLNDYYLKISLSSNCLTLISLNTSLLDNILYFFNLTPEEINQNDKYKNMSLEQLYEKIIELIEKGKYMISGDKKSVVLSIYEGEKFDLSQDLQFFLIKSNEEHNQIYQDAMKKIISSFKKENTQIKNEMNELKMNCKAQSADVLCRTAPIAEVKSEEFKKDSQIDDKATKKSNLSQSQREFKKKSTFGLNISTLSNMTYNSYPSVELSDNSFNIIVGYGGNTYNRVRMVLEIIKLIKKTTGLHVHCKVNLYQDEEDSLEICKILAENGADSLQITKFLSPQYFRKGQSNQDMLVSFADKVAKNVSIPVVLGGGRSDMDKIIELLNNTDIDFISMQRPFVKDPTFLTQWKIDGYGKSECKTCNNCYWKKQSVCLIEYSD